ncbi:MAG: type II secretion system F family protein [Nocardioidaceae bacterium]|nr:type II secretion system F family protein [Nocardioidaceae bacterium]
MTTLGVAVLAGVAVLLAWPPPPALVRRVPVRSGSETGLRGWRPVLVPLLVAAAWTLVGGTAGLALGLVAAGAGWRALGKVESPAARRRRHELERDLPIAVHLLGACLASGAAVTVALDTVARAVGGAVEEELEAVRRRLALGADPVTVWQEVGRSGPLERLGRPLARALRSGAPVAAAISRLSDDLRAEGQLRRQAKARAVEVKATAPVGLCLLPAFLLLGVVPLTVSVFGSLQLFA